MIETGTNRKYGHLTARTLYQLLRFTTLETIQWSQSQRFLKIVLHFYSENARKGTEKLCHQNMKSRRNFVRCFIRSGFDEITSKIVKRTFFTMLFEFSTLQINDLLNQTIFRAITRQQVSQVIIDVVSCQLRSYEISWKKVENIFL